MRSDYSTYDSFLRTLNPVNLQLSGLGPTTNAWIHGRTKISVEVNHRGELDIFPWLSFLDVVIVCTHMFGFKQSRGVCRI